MAYVRVASVFVALAALSGATGLALGGGTTANLGGMTSPPPPPPPSKPTITEFTCANEGNGYWSFWGTVANPTGVADLIIELDGFASVNGQWVAVNPDGTFSMTILLQPTDSGPVGATLMDEDDVEYDEAETLVG